MTPAAALASALARAEATGWAGSDPYDGLMTPIGRLITPLGRLARFALSQTMLRVPPARYLLRPAPTVNPKALALFLGSVVASRAEMGESRANGLAHRLVDEISRRGIAHGTGSTGWGYPFHWQSRSFWAPAGTPNAVVTATVGWHLLDCAETLGIDRARALGVSAANFLAQELPRTDSGPTSAISYTPNDRTRVVNISALSARLLLRAASLSSSSLLQDTAERMTQFVIESQRPDGSWPYAADRDGDWEDSFHTGYVLESLIHLQQAGVDVPSDVLSRGLAAYSGFFEAGGASRLYRTNSSLLDAHSAAQGIVTYSAAGEPEIASRIGRWALDTLWIDERGYFAYRIANGRRDEREFIRWVQAWMALAMAKVAAFEDVADVRSPLKAASR